MRPIESSLLLKLKTRESALLKLQLIYKRREMILKPNIRDAIV